MTRNGQPIEQASIRNKVDPHISYSMSFVEWEAARLAGLDFYKWEQNEYPLSFKERVIAWYTLHNMVEAHVEDAKARKMK